MLLVFTENLSKYLRVFEKKIDYNFGSALFYLNALRIAIPIYQQTSKMKHNCNTEW